MYTKYLKHVYIYIYILSIYACTDGGCLILLLLKMGLAPHFRGRFASFRVPHENLTSRIPGILNLFCNQRPRPCQRVDGGVMMKCRASPAVKVDQPLPAEVALASAFRTRFAHIFAATSAHQTFRTCCSQGPNMKPQETSLPVF